MAYGENIFDKTAAMLLYLVTKNHSFSDGNKRIAATLFLWFLNGIIYNEDSSKRIADNTLVALRLCHTVKFRSRDRCLSR